MKILCLVCYENKDCDLSFHYSSDITLVNFQSQPVYLIISTSRKQFLLNKNSSGHDFYVIIRSVREGVEWLFLCFARNFGGCEMLNQSV